MDIDVILYVSSHLVNTTTAIIPIKEELFASEKAVGDLPPISQVCLTPIPPL